MADFLLSNEDKAHLFDLLWQESFIGLAEIDKSHKFVRVNKTFCDLLGYVESELLNMTWMDVTHEADIPGDLAYARRLLTKQETVYGMSKRYRHKFGHYVKAQKRVLGYYGGEDNGLIIFLVQVKPSVPPPAPIKTQEEIDKEIEASKKAWKDNLKWVLGAFCGIIITSLGAILENLVVQTAGLGILATIFGGYTLTKK